MWFRYPSEAVFLEETMWLFNIALYLSVSLTLTSMTPPLPGKGKKMYKEEEKAVNDLGRGSCYKFQPSVAKELIF